MLKKFMRAFMALTFVFGLTLSAAPNAEARNGGPGPHGHGHYHRHGGGGSGVGLGIAAGIIGLGILGAASSARAYPYGYSAYDDYGPECYRGPRECRWVGRRCFEDRYGDAVCRGGRYICERPLVCD